MGITGSVNWTGRGLLAGALWLIVAGCSSEYGSAIDVSGTVTLDGAPVADTQIIFHADSGLPANLRTVTGTTDQQGRYTLSSVFPASYTVALSKLTAAAYAPTDTPLANPEDDRLAPWAPQNSELRAEVTAETSTLDFNLKSTGSR